MLSFSRKWSPVLILLVVMAGFQALPERWHEIFFYTRSGLEHVEIWRLLTANLIHLSWGHWLLNGFALLLVCALFAEEITPGQAVFVALISGAGACLGLYWASPEWKWVAGLSGGLHGLFIYASLTGTLDRVPMARWLLAGVIAKIAWEQVSGPLPLAEGFGVSKVVIDAHMWGGVCGLLAAVFHVVWRRRGTWL
ncbi:MAG: rhombosortase [Gammaproteobacteria bacterium]|nr:rhombosortase [Gammaproteobacteria bacterium]